MSDEVDAAEKTIAAYKQLVIRALQIVSDVPFYASVEHEESAHLTIDGDDAILSWCYYESDYYGGGYLKDEETSFPVSTLFLSNDDLKALRKQAKKEKAEQNAKVRAAQEAVARERSEARDRQEFDRLATKYGHKIYR